MTTSETGELGNISPQRRLGFCLPNPTSRAGGKQKNLDPALNPFPFIRELDTAYTILPIKTVWVPFDHLTDRGPSRGRDTDGWEMYPEDLLNYTCHEAIHFHLSCTPLGYYTDVLHQYQYLALYLMSLKTGTLSVPSLKDPSGVFGKAQEALDLIDFPLSFVHELIATTVVRFNAEQGFCFLTPSLSAVVSQKLCRGESGSYFPCNPSFTTFITEQEKKNWPDFYKAFFPDVDFMKAYRRVLRALRKIGKSMPKEDSILIIMEICSYPFNYPPFGQISGIDLHSIDLASANVRILWDRPIVRLSALLNAIESAPKLHGMGMWAAYLQRVLPDLTFGESELPEVLQKLTLDTHWTRLGHPRVGEAFLHLYTRSWAEYQFIYELPLVRKENFSMWWQEESSYPLLLESMREAVGAIKSILAKEGEYPYFRGPRCLCTPEVRSHCVLKEYLKNFWQAVKPDRGYEDQFATHWQQPECM